MDDAVPSIGSLDGDLEAVLTPSPAEPVEPSGPAVPVAPAGGDPEEPEGKLAQALEVLKIPNFRYLWINTLTFSLARGTENFLFVWLVIELLQKGSGFAGVRLMFALGFPVVVLGLPAGVLADRFNRGALLQISQLGAAFVAITAAILIWTDAINFPLTVAIAIAVGIVTAIGMPNRNAIIPSVVPAHRLLNAVVLMSMAAMMSQIIGPAIGGATIAISGVAGAFMLQGILLLIGTAVLLPLKLPPIKKVAEVDGQKKKGMGGDIKEGFAFVLSNPGIRSLVIMLMLFSLFWMGPFQVLLPKVARDDLGVGPFGASLLFGFMGVGMLVGSLVLARLGDFEKKGQWFMASTLVGSMILVGLGLSQWYAVSAAVLAVGGVAGGFFMNLNQTLIQKHTPEHLMGRVMAIHTLGMMGLGPAGALLAGGVAALIGAQPWMIISGFLTFFSGLIMLLTQRQLRNLS